LLPEQIEQILGHLVQVRPHRTSPNPHFSP
jgi:hypothetical protein